MFKRKFSVISRNPSSFQWKKFKAASRKPFVSIPAVLRSRGTEVKSVDVAPVALSIGQTATFTLLNGTQEGSSFYNRIGRKISMKSILLQANITPSKGNAAATNQDYLRVMVIYDRQPNGAFPSLADVLTSYDNAGGTTSTAMDQLNMNNRDRFKVFMDERVLIPAIGISGVASTSGDQGTDINGSLIETFNIKRFIKLQGMETQYKSTSNPAVVGDVATGSLFLLTVSENVATANSAYAFFMQTRLRYWDQ